MHINSLLKITSTRILTSIGRMGHVEVVATAIRVGTVVILFLATSAISDFSFAEKHLGFTCNFWLIG